MERYLLMKVLIYPIYPPLSLSTVTKLLRSALYCTFIGTSPVAEARNSLFSIISTFHSPSTESSDVIENLSSGLFSPEYLTRYMCPSISTLSIPPRCLRVDSSTRQPDPITHIPSGAVTLNAPEPSFDEYIIAGLAMILPSSSVAGTMADWSDIGTIFVLTNVSTFGSLVMYDLSYTSSCVCIL